MITIYEQILSELAGELEDLESDIFAALRRHYPAEVTRRGLIGICFGYEPDETVDLNNNPEDRKIRKAIAHMTDAHLIPIVSSSRRAGYRLDLSESAARAVIAECRSRIERLQDRIRSREKMIIRMHQADLVLPGKIEKHADVTQPGLL